MSKDAQRNAASSSGIAEYAQDPDKAVRVAVQTAGFATLGGVYGAAAAFFRHAPTVPVALASGINFGTTAFIFFSLREYVSLPASNYLQTANAFKPIQSLHFRSVPESASAGIGTGALLAYYHFRQASRAVRGGITVGLGATLGQILLNEANAARVRYLERNSDTSSITSTGEIIHQLPARPPLTARAADALLSVAPVRRLTDDEYVQTLREQTAQTRQELRFVNDQIRLAELALDAQQRKSHE